MRILSVFVIFSVILLVFAALNNNNRVSAADAGEPTLVEQDIRCKVCEKAIEYAWNQGFELRQHCKSEERADPRCDYSQIHRFGVDEMVHEVCDKLPVTHHITPDSESFDLHFNDAKKPDHSAEDATLIRNTCLKWVHQEHGLEQVSLFIFANLEAGKHTNTILKGLQDRYCRRRACNPDFKQSHNIENSAHPDAHFHISKSQQPNDL